jgi:hypothetical protein
MYAMKNGATAFHSIDCKLHPTVSVSFEALLIPTLVTIVIAQIPLLCKKVDSLRYTTLTVGCDSSLYLEYTAATVGTGDLGLLDSIVSYYLMRYHIAPSLTASHHFHASARVQIIDHNTPLHPKSTVSIAEN